MRSFFRICFLMLLLLTGLLCTASAERVSSQVSLTIPKGMRSYRNQTIVITAPDDGVCDLEITSSGTTFWRRTDIPVTAGDNEVVWDGTGFDGEYMPASRFHMTVRFSDGEGNTSEETKTFTMDKPAMALMYFIPDSDTLWLDSKRSWFFMYETTSPGRVLMKVAPLDDPENFIGTVKLDAGESAERDSWDGCIDGTRLQEGQYRVVCYARSAPEWSHEFTLTVARGAPETQEVGVTGPIMPSRSATDEEIWELMTAPAVVFDNGQGTGNDILSKPGKGGKVLGHVHGTGTALEVIRIEEGGKWAYVGAWNLQKANYIEGYVKVSDLKVVTPAQDYGLLIDKQTQTMVIFANGERVAELKVSTGNPALKYETEAGSYLTCNRLASFRTGSYRYEFPFRINGATLIHSVGWLEHNSFRSFENENARLGTKASHGCVRVERTTEGGYNAWWLWTHLRWNTRVIIMDDPVQRAEYNASAGKTGRDDMPYTGAGTNGWD